MNQIKNVLNVVVPNFMKEAPKSKPVTKSKRSCKPTYVSNEKGNCVVTMATPCKEGKKEILKQKDVEKKK